MSKHKVKADAPAMLEALLAEYRKAAAMSRAVGRPIRFQVDVDQAGHATLSPLVDPPLGPRDTSVQSALEAARAVGRVRVAEILSSAEMLSADQFAALLGTSRMTVNARRQRRQVLGLEGAVRGFRYPDWQVGADGKPYSAIPGLFARLEGGPWSVYRFLMQRHPELDGLTGREALRLGKAAEVLATADSVADGAFV